MFKLTLSNFRCFSNKIVEIPISQVILLNGPSGIGKTTIFEAISFVLYDSNNYAPIMNNNKKNEITTSVKLSFPNNLTIFRQKKPNLLKITGENNFLLLDIAAEEYILKTYGSENYWRTGAYLEQGKTCSFLTLSTNEKMQFLREITPSNNYEKIMKNIENSTSRLINEKISYQNIYTSNKMLYSRIYNENYSKINGISLWTIAKYEEICKEYNLAPMEFKSFAIHISNYYTILLQDLQKKCNSIKVEYEKALYVQQQRKNYTEKLAILVPMTENNFATCISSLSAVKDKILKKKASIERALLLEKEKDLLKKIESCGITHDPKYSLLELQRFEGILKIISKKDAEERYELVKKCLYYYLYMNIKKIKDEYSDQCQKRKNYYLYYKKKYINYREYEINLENEIISYSQKILLLNNSKKLQCPQCNVSVYLHNNCLVAGQNSETLDECKKKLSILQELQKIKKILQSEDFSSFDLISDINNELQEPIYSRYEYETAKREYEKLNLQEFNEEPKIVPQMKFEECKIIESQINNILEQYKSIPSEINLEYIANEKENIEKNISKKEYNLEYEKLKSQLLKYPSIEEDNIEIESLQRTEKELENQIINEKRLRNEIELYTNNLNSLPELNSEKINMELQENEKKYNDTFAKYSKLNEEISQQQILQYLNETFNTMTAAQNKYAEIEKEEQCLQKIKSLIVTAEYVLLDTVLTKINSSVAEILELLFDKPILVELKSLRQLKTSERIKPEINIEILYNGNEFNGLNKLSGGEQARISLALLIAFSKIGKIPFILIDESLSCLDSTAKENAIQVIRRHLGNKTCIAINHDSRVGGIYDHEIIL